MVLAGNRQADRPEVRIEAQRHPRGRFARRRRDLLGDLMQDVRYGLRALRRAPGFTAVSILTVALGVGATTAIFSVIHAVILRPLPYPDAERVVMVWMDNRRQGIAKDVHSYPNYSDYRTQNGVLATMAGFTQASFNLTGGIDPLRIRGTSATADLFRVLGVAPLIGRVFTADQEMDGQDGVVLLSHGFWSRAFGADSGIVGRMVQMDGRPRTVIGVMPRDFAFPAKDTEIWVPLVVPPRAREARNAYWLSAVGRLDAGVSLERAREDMATIGRRLEQAYPELEGVGVNLVPLPEEVVGGTLRTALWVLLGAVIAVLLIACANVANLLLSRAATREREIGVRIALGASRTRLVSQFLTESVLLGVAGGAAGVGLAWGALRVLKRLAPADLPRAEQVAIDPLVLGFALLLSVMTGLAFGLVPAFQSSRTALAEVLREGGRGGTAGRQGQRLRRVLVAAQVMLVVVLLTGAGLLIRSFIELQRVDLGFRAERLLTVRFALPAARYDSPASVSGFYDALLDRTRLLPGVQGVAASSGIFLTDTPNSADFVIEGRPTTPQAESIEAPIDVVSPDYFQVMGIPLIRGRAFSAQDRTGGSEVVILNDAMARRFWPNADVIGRRFKYGRDPGGTLPWMTIVGVVGDMRRGGFDRPVRYETFLPHAQAPTRSMTLVVRTSGEPALTAGVVRQVVRELDRDLPVFEVRTMDELLSEMTSQRRFNMTLLAAFAALALVLALVGVYGVTAYLVAQRTREIGVRLALGAGPRSVVRLVVRQGMTAAAVGLVFGVIGALALTRLMSGLVYGVSVTDATTFGAVVLLLGVATVVANWIPARRAARVDPVVALRQE
jgi:putative ABC transport system permease protein